MAELSKSTESALLKRRRQMERRAEYLRETGRGVTLVPQTRAGAAADARERARRWESAVRAIRTAKTA